MSDDHDDRELWRRWGGRSATGAGCPDAGTLAALGDGRIAPGERATLEAHLAACPRCVGTLGDLRRLERTPLAPVSPAQVGRWVSAIQAERAPALRLPARLAIAAMLALACGAGFLLGARAMGDAAVLGRAAGELPFDLSPAVSVP